MIDAADHHQINLKRSKDKQGTVCSKQFPKNNTSSDQSDQKKKKQRKKKEKQKTQQREPKQRSAD